MTPPPTDLVDQLRHEIDEEAPPPAIVLPPVSGPLSNAAASVVNTIEEEAGDNETDEEASDDDSDKDPTFIRSLGAWSKPLHFTPPPTPPEPATPRFGVTEMLQSQIDSFWPSIGEATVNGPKQKGHLMLPKKSMTQMPVDKIPPPALKEDGEAEYYWIPSACDRCGALGHKEKRCLLPPKPHDSATVTKEPQVTNEEIPVVNIVHLAQNSFSTLVENLEPCSGSLSTQQALETPEKSLITTPSEVAVVTPFTDSHEVHSTSCSEIDVTIPMLAAANVAPSNSPIMEAIPSQSIIVEDPSSSANEQQIDPTTPPTHNQQQFYRESEIPVTYGKGAGFDVVGESSGYNLTRGGREIKPTQKFQDMEWTNVSGRGKRGRRGRGNHNH
uniref:Uncharacterized protein n=1 Tax=Brassica campestris TaxID=3711 RepID=M4CQT3_BRACM